MLCSLFDKLRDVREMEYELDFVTNRASRDAQVRRVIAHHAITLARPVGDYVWHSVASYSSIMHCLNRQHDAVQAHLCRYHQYTWHSSVAAA